MSLTRRVRTMAVVAAIGTAAAVAVVPSASAAPASPAVGTLGSIVYIKDHNVWIARGDGSGAHAVTTDGTASNDYWSPSQSDTGVVVAAHGPFAVRMQQNGQVLSRIDVPPLKNSAGENMDFSPSEVAISPNGKTIAYTFSRYSCPAGVSCGVRSATGYVNAATGRRAGTATFFHDPSWVSNTRTLQSGGFGSQVMLQDTTAAAVHWFDDSDYANPSTDLSDGEVSPNGKWLAEIRGYNDTTHVIWYRVRDDVRTTTPRTPKWNCFTNEAAGFRSPTWSPDSTKVIWEEPDGIWIEPDAAGCGNTDLLIAGGASPDWSKAPLQ